VRYIILVRLCLGLPLTTLLGDQLRDAVYGEPWGISDLRIGLTMPVFKKATEEAPIHVRPWVSVPVFPVRLPDQSCFG
jgi:hypothetical protein